MNRVVLRGGNTVDNWALVWDIDTTITNLALVWDITTTITVTKRVFTSFFKFVVWHFSFQHRLALEGHDEW